VIGAWGSLQEFLFIAETAMRSMPTQTLATMRTIKALSWLRELLLVSCLFGTAVTWEAHGQDPQTALNFSKEIRPILSNNCFPCHGPDEGQRKAKLRLDTQAGSRKDLGGHQAIAPGAPEESELIRRIFSDDPDEIMPPKDSNRSLSQSQKQQLQQWIQNGAIYDEHWAWIPPKRPRTPSTENRPSWAKNGIDHFILNRLNYESLEPSHEADRPTLIRRLSLDLTGLPPSPEEADAFQNDPASDAYEKLVERLLKSPHYGERMAVDWLDAARYADTNGYQVDRNREMHAWRDWVIAAFNDNKPFDEFTIEQLAGDLLPNPSLEQRIATGFHRNHMMNEEGGIIPEEFLAEYCADRVETTATVWLGQTFNCTRCHDHKFDPFTQKDYYSIYAFFHNIDELGRGDYGKNIRRNNPPMIQLPAPKLEAARANHQTALEALQRKLDASAKDSSIHEELSKEVAKLKKKVDEADLAIPTALVMRELPKPRPTYILIRGAYDKHGEEVSSATPSSLLPMADTLPRNRLGLAQWLVDPANPLTARVTVNRLWQSIFGTGIVSTPGDFGTQGSLPSHPELLDWLAVEFVESGWDIKAMMRLLVTSATYRQSSQLNPTLTERDPQNRLLARGSRYRLQAEFLRDQALAASSLLVRKIGGPSVRPYHPPGLYEQVVAGKGASTYVQDKGTGLYRRTMYSYWKRSVPNPSMLTFDAPFRETCTVRRSRTNTPMQALNLMNDPTYVEAAKFLAHRMLVEGGPTVESRLTYGFRLVTARPPTIQELSHLQAATQRSIAEFEANPEEASALLKEGEAPFDESPIPIELAAYSIVASIILNLDETVTRE
jgi:hypothetical protein